MIFQPYNRLLVAGAHGTHANVQHNTGRSNPVASPERIPTAPGSSAEGSMTPSKNGASPLGHQDSSPQPKAFYRDRTLIYVERDDRHDVVDAHWKEYLRLRRRKASVVRLHSTLREMRRVLYSEGALI